MYKYTKLFNQTIQDWKADENGQGHGSCPFHNDNNPSFSAKEVTGLWKCHAGCGEGNIWQFIEKLATQFHNYLVQNYDSLCKHLPWSLDSIKELKVGFDKSKQVFTFPHFNENGRIVNIKWHKGKNSPPRSLAGLGSNRLYPLNIATNYNQDNWLVYCEGEKDVVTLRSNGIQAITHTTGATSMPQNIDILKSFENIFITMDKDKTGQIASTKIASTLQKLNRNAKIKIIKWNDKLPEKYDITDFFSDSNSKKDFIQLHSDSEEYKQTDEIGYKTLNAIELLNSGFTSKPALVNEILQDKGIATIAGTDNVGKSFYALQFACCCAQGIDFLGYKTLKPMKVLILNYELTNWQMNDRLDLMKKYIDDNYPTKQEYWKNLSFNVLSENIELFKDQWENIDETLEKVADFDIVVVDNLYTSTESNLSENKEGQALWGRIHRLRYKHKVAFLLVNHHIKNPEKHKTLNKDMIRGGKSFTDFCTNVAQLGNSTLNENWRVFKVTKCRDISETLNLPQLLVKNGVFFVNRGVIESEEIHFIETNSRPEFQALDRFLGVESFTTQDWIDYCTFTIDPIVSERTAKGWLRKLLDWGRLEKIVHGEYKVRPMDLP